LNLKAVLFGLIKFLFFPMKGWDFQMKSQSGFQAFLV